MNGSVGTKSQAATGKEALKATIDQERYHIFGRGFFSGRLLEARHAAERERAEWRDRKSGRTRRMHELMCLRTTISMCLRSRQLKPKNLPGFIQRLVSGGKVLRVQ